MASATSARDREFDELWQKSMKAIGIRHRVPEAEMAGPDQDGQARQAADVARRLDHAVRRGRRVRATALRPEHRADQLRALRAARVRRAVPRVAAPARRAGAQQDLSPDVGARRRVQPVVARRLHDREHARAAVGAGLQEARVLGASVEVPRRRRRAAERPKNVPCRESRSRGDNATDGAPIDAVQCACRGVARSRDGASRNIAAVHSSTATSGNRAHHDQNADDLRHRDCIRGARVRMGHSRRRAVRPTSVSRLPPQLR